MQRLLTRSTLLGRTSPSPASYLRTLRVSTTLPSPQHQHQQHPRHNLNRVQKRFKRSKAAASEEPFEEAKKRKPTSLGERTLSILNANKQCQLTSASPTSGLPESTLVPYVTIPRNIDSSVLFGELDLQQQKDSSSSTVEEAAAKKGGNGKEFEQLHMVFLTHVTSKHNEHLIPELAAKQKQVLQRERQQRLEEQERLEMEQEEGEGEQEGEYKEKQDDQQQQQQQEQKHQQEKQIQEKQIQQEQQTQKQGETIVEAKKEPKAALSVEAQAVQHDLKEFFQSIQKDLSSNVSFSVGLSDPDLVNMFRRAGRRYPPRCVFSAQVSHIPHESKAFERLWKEQFQQHPHVAYNILPSTVNMFRVTRVTSAFFVDISGETEGVAPLSQFTGAQPDPLSPYVRTLISRLNKDEELLEKICAKGFSLSLAEKFVYSIEKSGVNIMGREGTFVPKKLRKRMTPEEEKAAKDPNAWSVYYLDFGEEIKEEAKLRDFFLDFNASD